MSVKVKLRRFIARNFSTLIEYIYKLKFLNINFDQEPILIITPGKVGSSSIYETIKGKLKNHVYHIHQFSEDSINNAISRNLKSDRKSRPLHLIISKLLRKKIEAYKGDIFIITIVREPISRLISSFFQNTEVYKSQIEDRNLEINSKRSIELIYNEFDKSFCEEVEQWFDSEIKNNFGIDVFSDKFDYKKKYVIKHHKNNHLLLLRMEDMNEVFPTAIQELLNLKSPLKLSNTNVGEMKHYGEVYYDIKSNLKFSDDVIEKVINSKYFRSFYEGDETKIRKKWSKPHTLK
ncbi:hypothetical protein A9Q86_07705 [Flavobacteriales bacterium 33_180_T64]|nr:hypothetical protein A9Q86_07705 [Flavobacteriales bacterium 33_180_T64]